jgi:hypothetical protein
MFTARYALSPYIKQIRSVFKGLMALYLSYPFTKILTASAEHDVKANSHRVTLRRV